MATVQQIIDRLVQEDPYYGTFRPGLGTSRTEKIQAITPENGDSMAKWLPNRKVVSGLVAGAVAWASVKLFGAELDAELASAVVGVVMAVISYLVPLPKDQTNAS